jgi:hypothetical protein
VYRKRAHANANATTRSALDAPSPDIRPGINIFAMTSGTQRRTDSRRKKKATIDDLKDSLGMHDQMRMGIQGEERFAYVEAIPMHQLSGRTSRS